jgi:hypothetical protein
VKEAQELAATGSPAVNTRRRQEALLASPSEEPQIVARRLRLPAGDEGEDEDVLSEEYEDMREEDAWRFLTREDGQAVLDVLVHRWDMLHSPLHAAGVLLDPEFVKQDMRGNAEVQAGMKTVLKKMLTVVRRGKSLHGDSSQG